MQEPGVLDDASVPYAQSLGPWGRRLHALTRWFAIGGGIGFIALVMMSLVSIIGRKIAATPVPGADGNGHRLGGDAGLLRNGAPALARGFFYCKALGKNSPCAGCALAFGTRYCCVGYCVAHGFISDVA
jgi:hypothetical protein